MKLWTFLSDFFAGDEPLETRIILMLALPFSFLFSAPLAAVTFCSKDQFLIPVFMVWLIELALILATIYGARMQRKSPGSTGLGSLIVWIGMAYCFLPMGLSIMLNGFLQREWLAAGIVLFIQIGLAWGGYSSWRRFVE